MPNFRFGPKTQYVFYHETSFGTPGNIGKQGPTTTGDLSFWGREQRGDTKRRPANFNPSRPGRGFYVADGRASFIAQRDWMGLMFHKLFGPATVTGTTDPYTHVFKIGDQEGGSLTIEIQDQLHNVADRMNAVKAIGMTIRVAKEPSEAEFTVDFLGTGKATFNATPLDATPDLFTDPVYPVWLASVTIDGTSNILVTDVSINARRYASSPGVLNGQRWGEYVLLGQWNEFSVDVTGLWTVGSDDLRSIVDSNQHSLKVTLTNPADTTHPLEILMPKCDVYIEQFPNIGEGERNVQLRFYPTSQNATENTSLQITLKSPVADFGTAWTI